MLYNIIYSHDILLLIISFQSIIQSLYLSFAEDRWDRQDPQPKIRSFTDAKC